MHERLDIIGGIGVCLGGVGLACIGYLSGKSSTLEIGLAVLVASAIYLLFRNRIASSSNPSLPASKSLILILSIIFFCTFAASIYLMHSSMYRPPLYFLLTSILVVVITTQILCSNNETRVWLLLLEILLVSFSLRYGLLYELPGFYGADPWWHSLVVEDWISYNHITPQISIGYTSYVEFPLMHLNVMALRIMTLLNPKDSFFSSIGLFYILSTLFTFLLGRCLIDTKAGLLAALVISFTQFHISWGAWLIPMSMGISIFAMLLWLIFRDISNFSSILILVTMSLVVVLTHTVSSFIIAIALTLFFIADRVFKRQYGVNRGKIIIGHSFVILFWVAMLTRWVYSFYYPSASFFDSVMRWFVSALRTDIEYVGVAFEASATPLGPLNRVGFLMLIGFIVIGSLFWLSSKAINDKRVRIIIGVLGLSIVTVVFPLFNIENLIPGRWPVFIAVLGAPVAVEGILALSRLLKGKLRKSLLLVLLIFIFSMFMINSYGVNTCTPFYGKGYMQNPTRHAFTGGELGAVETIAEIYDGQVTTDSDYSCHPFRAEVGQKRVKYLSVESENEGLSVIREYIRIHQAIEKCSEEQYNKFLASFNGSRYNMIYDDGKVKAYLAR